MRSTALFRRATVAASLLLTAALSALWVLLVPPFPATTLAQLQQIEAGGDVAVLSATAFLVAQLPFIVAAIGVTQLIGQKSPMIAAIGGTLAVIGGFGHAAYAGFQLAVVTMASDVADHDVYARLLDGELPAIVDVLAVGGTVGTVLGLILLGVGLLRARVGVRWIPYVLWAFVVVEFVGTGLTQWAAYASAVLYLAALGALAMAVWRSRLELWTPGPMAAEPAEAAVADSRR
ncbi:hypothetical protein [Diaminobutyricimonas sp. TR449]|uniref:hypothetical protein n=1 Tax=Diaminobutyricimonas sp. TR449 TaxID=2708076 RepID=UPI0014216BD1|nr:hypothetical protein [Diaminobutyricimonas sp. TR449]